MKAVVDFGEIFLDQSLIRIGLPQKRLDLPNWVAPIHLHDRVVSEKLASFSGRLSDEQAPRGHGLQVPHGKSRYHASGFRICDGAREANAQLCIRQPLSQVLEGGIIGLKYVVNPVSHALGRYPRMIWKMRTAKREDVDGAFRPGMCQIPAWIDRFRDPVNLTVGDASPAKVLRSLKAREHEEVDLRFPNQSFKSVEAGLPNIVRPERARFIAQTEVRKCFPEKVMPVRKIQAKDGAASANRAEDRPQGGVEEGVEPGRNLRRREKNGPIHDFPLAVGGAKVFECLQQQHLWPLIAEPRSR